MKDLLAVITPVSDDILGCATNYALALAELSGGHLSALIVEIEPDHPAASQRVQLDNEVARLVSATDRRTRTIELVEAAAKVANVPCTFLPADRRVSLREVLIGHSQVRDLVILDVQEPLRYPRLGLVEAVLFGSGRPIILVPPTARSFAGERALVAWDATRSAVRALHDALPVLVRARES